MTERAFPSIASPLAAFLFGGFGFAVLLPGAQKSLRESIDACQESFLNSTYDPVECATQMSIGDDLTYLQAFAWAVPIFAVVWVGSEVLNWLLTRGAGSAQG